MSRKTLSRTTVQETSVRTSGPYEAIVINHLDRTHTGVLEVELLKYSSALNTPKRTGQLVKVRYLSPFYGVTPYEGLKPNDGYENTQKSYGFWAVPPDPGVKVLVVFAEGHTAYGYWIGCIQDHMMNFMVPDGRASTSLTTDDTPPNLKNKKLPVGEYNKSLETGQAIDPTLFRKPYNRDFTSVLEVQGLINDETRGTTTTSARREAPSMVFGISTPGPLDKRQGRPTYQYGEYGRTAEVPFNRLGGSSFVMDDGDDKLVRATHAEDGPPIYLNRRNNEGGGDETIPQNELIRLRTRTGHQILLHNSEDLIYIANSRGTAWIELTSDGKIDIHAQDSISIMSDADINFTAERDFNIDAGRNINMRATARWSDMKIQEEGKESGRVQIESKFNSNWISGKDFKFDVREDLDLFVSNEFKTTVNSNVHLKARGYIKEQAEGAIHQTSGHSFFRTSNATLHDIVANNAFMSVGGDIHRESTGGSIYDEASEDSHLVAKNNIYETAYAGEIHMLAPDLIAGDADQIHWNSGKAEAAIEAETGLRATEPSIAIKAENLSTVTLPYVYPGVDTPIPYESILTRAPQHEPWPHHENMNPLEYKKHKTDREGPGRLTAADRILTPDTFVRNGSVSPVQSSIRVSGSGGLINSGTEGGEGIADDHARGLEDGDYTLPAGSPTGNAANGEVIGGQQTSRFGGAFDSPLLVSGPYRGTAYTLPGNNTWGDPNTYQATLPSNIRKAPGGPPFSLPRQSLLNHLSEALRRAAAAPRDGVDFSNVIIQITPNGGLSERLSYGTDNHPFGYAADFQLLINGRGPLTPETHREHFITIGAYAARIGNANGFSVGLGGYSRFMHYDISGFRQNHNGNPYIATWGTSIASSAKTRAGG